MIAVLSLLCILGVFIAGHIFGVYTILGIGMLGVFVMCLGLLIAAAETRGFEGQYVPLSTGVTWETVSKQLFLLNENKCRFFNGDKLYVQTPTGPVAVTGVFQARINHEMSIVLDTTDVDHAHTFNALKQGVM